MRIILLFLFIHCFNFSPAQTNVYHPFPDSNAVWRESLASTDGSFGLNLWEEQKFILGDTVLGNLVYHKVYRSGLAMHCMVPCNYTDTLNYYYNIFAGVFREGGNKKIYTYDANQQRDTLLYDFDLQLGDTIPDSYNHLPASVNPITVDAIDSVFDGSNYRKRFVLSGMNSSIIEGVGAMCGLFVPLDTYIFESGGTLHCFIQNDSVKYTDSSMYACDIINAAISVSAENNSVTLFPNPFHSSAKLEIRDLKNDLNGFVIKIYNVMGTVVRDEEIINITSYILHRAGLSDGLYFYKLTTQKNEPIGVGGFIIE